MCIDRERFADLDISLITEEDVVWINSETGEMFDPEQMITEDVTLVLQR